MSISDEQLSGSGVERLKTLRQLRLVSLRVGFLSAITTLAITFAFIIQRQRIVQCVAVIPAVIGSAATYYRFKWVLHLDAILRKEAEEASAAQKPGAR